MLGQSEVEKLHEPAGGQKDVPGREVAMHDAIVVRRSKRLRHLGSDIEDLVEGKLRGASIDEATIVLYALGTSSEFLESLSRKLRRGCRLVYYYNTLFPEIKADYL